MALRNCKECGRRVSTTAPTCPGCGAVLRKKPASAGDGLIVLVILIIIVALAVAYVLYVDGCNFSVPVHPSGS